MQRLATSAQCRARISGGSEVFDLNFRSSLTPHFATVSPSSPRTRSRNSKMSSAATCALGEGNRVTAIFYYGTTEIRRGRTSLWRLSPCGPAARQKSHSEPTLANCSDVAHLRKKDRDGQGTAGWPRNLLPAGWPRNSEGRAPAAPADRGRGTAADHRAKAPGDCGHRQSFILPKYFEYFGWNAVSKKWVATTARGLRLSPIGGLRAIWRRDCGYRSRGLQLSPIGGLRAI